jgi:hypothetical protein
MWRNKMSNRASICQETHIIRHNGEEQKTISIFDDYGECDIFVKKFIDNDLELLEDVVRSVKEEIGVGEIIETIINYVRTEEKGIYIEGKWYDWEEIKPVFDKVYSEE